MEKAIKIAIENGYTMFGRATEPLFKWWIDTSYKDFRILIGYDYATRNYRDEVSNSHDYIWIQAILLDPLFWQALGKGLGWTFVAYKNGSWRWEETDLRHMSDTPFRYPEWQYWMHRFIDHLAEGKDINSFFEELTKNHENK